MTFAVQDFLDGLKTALAAALPGRTVTDSYLDHAQRDLADLQAGVITILAGSVEPQSEWVDKISFRIIGQIAVDESTQKPGDVQRAELLLYRQIRAFCANPGNKLSAQWIRKARLSNQIEYPFGWIVVEMEQPELDISSDDDALTYPPSLTQAAAFAAVKLGIDIEPHASAAQAAAWIAADGDGEAADQTLLVELPQ